jgi:hypothetical protein
MGYRPRTKPTRQRGKEGYRYLHFDTKLISESSSLYRLHITKSPVLRKDRVFSLCGEKGERFSLSGFVTDKYIKDFPERMCHECVDLWKSILIVEE